MTLADKKISRNVAGSDIKNLADPSANYLNTSLMSGRLFITTKR